MNWRRRIAAITQSEVTGGRKLAGGDLGGATLVELADGRRLVAKAGPLAEREAAMLVAIGKTGTPAPHVLYSGDGLLLMDYLEADADRNWESLAEALEQLHAPRADPYGWEANYAFGAVEIANVRSENWAEFWAENRLLCHADSIDSSIARRLDRLAARTADIIPSFPEHALLHGDLWGGNILFRRHRLAALIDPACYVGHREADVAMLTLFDHPPDEFFDALALESGWRERLPVYRLWPLLVHLRLFGTSYRGAVTNALQTLGF